MYIFSALFTLSLLLLIIALIILIPKRTRNVGKKASIVFLTTTILLYFIASKENIYPNDEPGTITKAQYQSLKEDMSKNEIQEKLGKPNEKDDDINEWEYKIINGSTITNNTVTLHFDPSDRLDLKMDGDYFNPNKKATKVEMDNEKQIDSEEDDKDLVQYDTEDIINSFVDENFKSGTELTELELNDNMGTKKKNDYIALVHMKMDRVYSAKSGFNWIDKYSNYLAAELANHDNNISELVIFWTMPQFADKDYNVAKYTLKRNGKKFYFESEWQDNSLLDK